MEPKGVALDNEDREPLTDWESLATLFDEAEEAEDDDDAEELEPASELDIDGQEALEDDAI